MVISKDKMVTLHYTLKDDNGVTLDTSVDKLPLLYVHGNGYLIQGLEKELEGKKVGDVIHTVVQPEDAYGKYEEKLVAVLPRKSFEIDGDINIGMQFQMTTSYGPTIVRVTKVDGDNITIDANHELAGKTLHFDLEILEVRDITQQERDSMHSGCGCHGGCGGCGDSCDSECTECSDCGGECNGSCENECHHECQCAN